MTLHWLKSVTGATYNYYSFDSIHSGEMHMAYSVLDFKETDEMNYFTVSEELENTTSSSKLAVSFTYFGHLTAQKI